MPRTPDALLQEYLDEGYPSRTQEEIDALYNQTAKQVMFDMLADLRRSIELISTQQTGTRGENLDVPLAEQRPCTCGRPGCKVLNIVEYLIKGLLSIARMNVEEDAAVLQTILRDMRRPDACSEPETPEEDDDDGN